MRTTMQMLFLADGIFGHKQRKEHILYQAPISLTKSPLLSASTSPHSQLWEHVDFGRGQLALLSTLAFLRPTPSFLPAPEFEDLTDNPDSEY